MTVAHRGSHLCRLVDVLLPGGGTLMVIYEGYFDESGDFEKDPKVFCVAGYFIASEEAKAMDERWGDVLREHNLPYFHMVDCAHGVGVFTGREKSERIEVETKLIHLIKTHTLSGFSVLAKGDLFEISEKHPDVYSSCVSTCVTALQSFLEINRIRGNIAYFFEAGHKNKGRAYNHVAEKIQQLSASLTFAAKEQVRLLQAADLLAWQSTKYTKDRLSKARPPRKDFMSLMEHRHTLAHFDMTDGEPAIAFEDWPLSRRSQTTAILSLKREGPIPFFIEEGEKIPIIPVQDVIGWRMGAGRLIYVAFTEAGNKEFALAFDELGIRGAVLSLMSASELYEERRTLSFDATGISVENLGDEVVLRFQLFDEGPTLTVRLSKNMVDQLKSELK